MIQYYVSFEGLIYLNKFFTSIDDAKKFLHSSNKISKGEVYTEDGDIVYKFYKLQNQDEKK